MAEMNDLRLVRPAPGLTRRLLPCYAYKHLFWVPCRKTYRILRAALWTRGSHRQEPALGGASLLPVVPCVEWGQLWEAATHCVNPLDPNDYVLDRSETS